MTDPGFRELSGLPANPDCLHCVLAPVIGKFRVEHPDTLPGEITMDLVRVLAEYIASTAPQLCDIVAASAGEALCEQVKRAHLAFQRAGRH